MLRLFWTRLIIILSCLITATGCAYSKSSCDGTLQSPCVVKDTNDDTKNIKNYRDAFMIDTAYQGNRTGLSSLWVSASATPSKSNLKAIMKNVTNVSNGKVKKVLDIDLREESHGLLNDEAITLNNEHNWINMGKTHQQSLADEQMWLNSLRQMSKVENVMTPDDFKAGNFNKGVDVKVKSVASEQEVAEKEGFEYIRLTITDHMGPGNIEVDRFVQLVKNLPSGTWVHVHCRGGEGRATTFMAMYDMLQNADKVSFDEIMKRQASVYPYYDLYHTVHKNPDLSYYYEERLKFLKHFYQFANDYRRGYQGNWTTWSNENHLV